MSSITDSFPDGPSESTTAPVVLRRLSSPVTAVAFWLAIAMPMAYVPLLVTGFDGSRELALFVGLILVHLLALRAGRSHRAE